MHYRRNKSICKFGVAYSKGAYTLLFERAGTKLTNKELKKKQVRGSKCGGAPLDLLDIRPDTLVVSSLRPHAHALVGRQKELKKKLFFFLAEPPCILLSALLATRV